MSSAAEQRKPQTSDGDAILNALPNPVLVVGPDGKIMDANMAAETFFDSSAQFLRRQSLKNLVPFGSPLLALIDQVRTTNAPADKLKAWRETILRSEQPSLVRRALSDAFDDFAWSAAA